MLSRRARAVIAVSPANIDDYVGAVGRHPFDDADSERRGHGALCAPAAGGSPQRSAQIVQIGRYTSVKNQLSDGACVRARHRVGARGPACCLYGVIEDPAYYAAVNDLVAKLGLAGRVTCGRAAFGRVRACCRHRACSRCRRARKGTASRSWRRWRRACRWSRARSGRSLRRRFSRRALVRSRRYARLRERARDGAARAALAAAAWRASRCRIRRRGIWRWRMR